MTQDSPVTESDAPVTDDGTPWLRLHSRMIWVDIVQTVLSLTPAGIAILIVGTGGGFGSLWPVILVAVFGVIGAVADFLRWVFTRYRVTDDYVERRTGIFVRRYRSVRRDRIRSVDIDARLRHRLSGLRVVQIGAGQQMAAMESALRLDAILRADAEQLRHLLIRRTTAQDLATVSANTAAGTAPAPESDADGEVFARLRPQWVFYNMFSIWAYVMALGLLWGAFWLIAMFGVDMREWVQGTLDWDALGLAWTVVISFVVIGAVGVAGMAVNFFTTHWNFELARIPGEKGTLLRTRQGLLRTREVNRDENRTRGIHISEPLLWRWIGMADTNLVTTGLSVWSLSQPTQILPRGPIGVAKQVADRVLGVAPSPLHAPLTRHPRRALLRRLWWATMASALVVGVLALFAFNAVIDGDVVILIGAIVWPVCLVAGFIAYRALGHGTAGEYLVIRSGLMSRATTVLEKSAVSTIAIRQSILQQRLGLKTVSAMTAAGYSAYDAPDVSSDQGVEFAAQAAPGLLDEFVERVSA